MDISEFLLAIYKENVALVNAVAWPLAAVVSVSLFRREVRGLLDRVVSVNWREGVLQLREAVREAQADIAVVEAGREAAAAPIEASSPAGLGRSVRPQDVAVHEAQLNSRDYVGKSSNPPTDDDDSGFRKRRYQAVHGGTTPSYMRVVLLLNRLAKEHSDRVELSSKLEDQIEGLVDAGLIPESVGIAVLELRSQRRRLFASMGKIPDARDIETFNSLAADVYELVTRASVLARNRAQHSAENGVQ